MDKSSAAFFIDCNQAKFLYQKGLDGLDLLDRLSTNSILSLSEKDIKTTIVTDEKGKIVDILNVWKINNEKLLLESSTPNIDKLVFWINQSRITYAPFIPLKDTEVTPGRVITLPRNPNIGCT